MSKASQTIVLCEDKAHEMFVKRFLKIWGVKPRAIRVPPYPHGKGSGKKHVEDKISLEANAILYIPQKRETKKLIGWLYPEEVAAVLKGVDLKRNGVYQLFRPKSLLLYLHSHRSKFSLR